MITRQHIITWLKQSADVLDEKRAYLSDLDAPIGDSDHGNNMARGFAKLVEKLPSVEDTDIGNILKTSGMALISSVGGASGPLYGTMFMRAASPVQSKQELTGDDVLAMLKAGLEGVVQRGRAEIGDKTMVDAYIPAIEALEKALTEGMNLPEALTVCADAAENGVESTKPLIAKKGRASYLGERSQGHQDPGATSLYFLLRTLANVVNK